MKIIPKNGIALYRMQLFQMSNADLKQELLRAHIYSSHEAAAKKEYTYRQLEEFYESKN